MSHDNPSSDLVLISDAAASLASSFAADRLESADDVETLIQWVAKHVAHLLERDLAKLTQIFYRVDVPESEVKRAFAQHDARTLAHRLAKLLVDRHLEKLSSHFDL